MKLFLPFLFFSLVSHLFAGERQIPLVVTASDYCFFLNQVAKDDTYQLYDQTLSYESKGAAIVRDGLSGQYQYFVIAGCEELPVFFVSPKNQAYYKEWLQYRSRQLSDPFNHLRDQEDWLASNMNDFFIFHSEKEPSLITHLIDDSFMNNFSKKEFITGGVIFIAGILAGNELFGNRSLCACSDLATIREREPIASHQGSTYGTSLLNRNKPLPPAQEPLSSSQAEDLEGKFIEQFQLITEQRALFINEGIKGRINSEITGRPLGWSKFQDDLNRIHELTQSNLAGIKGVISLKKKMVGVSSSDVITSINEQMTSLQSLFDWINSQLDGDKGLISALKIRIQARNEQQKIDEELQQQIAQKENKVLSQLNEITDSTDLAEEDLWNSLQSICQAEESYFQSKQTSGSEKSRNLILQKLMAAWNGFEATESRYVQTLNESVKKILPLAGYEMLKEDVGVGSTTAGRRASPLLQPDDQSQKIKSSPLVDGYQKWGGQQSSSISRPVVTKGKSGTWNPNVPGFKSSGTNPFDD